MAITVRDIINSSNTFQEAVRVADSEISKGNNISFTEFYKEANKKWPLNDKAPQTFGSKSNIITDIGKIQSLEGGYRNPIGNVDITPETMTNLASELGSAFFSQEGGFKEGMKKTFSTILESMYEGSVQILRDEVALRNRLNSEITIGGQLSRQYRDNIIASSDAVKGMAYDMNQLIDASVEVTEKTGRFFTLTEKTLENMAVTSRAFIGNLSSMGQIFSDFERVGIGADRALENINESGKSSLTLGLNARRTTEELTKNIGRINQFGFENGVLGLNKMVQRSVEFRMNMQNVFDIADKVMSPEKAIDLAANLQVLGGAVGALGDPFQMMYMATNNVEGLQDALIGAAESLATYNSEQGKFEISGVNLRRARAMAEELGMSYQDLSNMAIAAAERTSASADLMAAGITVDEKEKEFITNIAKMGPGGKMIIEIPKSIAEDLSIDRELALDELNQATVNAILSTQKAFEKMDVKDIALEQFTETQKLSLTATEIAQMLKIQFAETYRGLGSRGDEIIKSVDTFLKNIKSGTAPENEYTKQFNELKTMAVKSANENAERNYGKIQAETPRKVDNTQQNQNQQTTIQTNQTPKKLDVNLNVNATQPILDTIQRQIVKDESLFTDFLSRSERDYFYVPQ
jgi:hypothetical protein